METLAFLAKNQMRTFPRKSIIIAVSLVTLFIPLSYFYIDVPTSYHRAYAPGSSSPAFVLKLQNDVPQPGYFKNQPEWDWEVPDYSSRWKLYARKPKSKDVVLLTASDGGGHNSEIPNVLERVLQNREDYCARHGYTSMWLNTSRYDIGDSHRAWSKIPAVAEAFYIHPNAEWVVLLDADIIIMTPTVDIIESIISPHAISTNILRNTPLLEGSEDEHPPYIRTPTSYRVEDVDILITQDQNDINAGVIFFRRSAFTRYLLEIMTDSRLMTREHGGAEQDSIKHLMHEHLLVRKHVGIYPQRKFNAYVDGGEDRGWRDGDWLVHFAGCWVEHVCKEHFNEFWDKRTFEGTWRPDDSHGKGLEGGLVGE